MKVAKVLKKVGMGWSILHNLDIQMQTIKYIII